MLITFFRISQATKGAHFNDMIRQAWIFKVDR